MPVPRKKVLREAKERSHKKLNPTPVIGMPPITTQYAPNIKRRKTLKSTTHRAYGRMSCVLGQSATAAATLT